MFSTFFQDFSHAFHTFFRENPRYENTFFRKNIITTQRAIK
jgi:hypothetical protein